MGSSKKGESNVHFKMENLSEQEHCKEERSCYCDQEKPLKVMITVLTSDPEGRYVKVLLRNNEEIKRTLACAYLNLREECKKFQVSNLTQTTLRSQ